MAESSSFCRLQEKSEEPQHNSPVKACFIMNCVAFLVVATNFLSCTGALYLHHNEDKEKELRYLLEPPVCNEIMETRGKNVTLPCFLRTVPSHCRVKWTKLNILNKEVENIILITNGHKDKQYGTLGPRASLRRAHAMDMSLHLTDLELQDDGQYRCEAINGTDDENVTITLIIDGVVFPYQSSRGRYKLNYFEAKEACAEQDATLATYKQLYKEWTAGLDWCNAGWLNDGTVHYPILYPRPECGKDFLPGIRSYGPKHKTRDHYDAFCFTSTTEGSVFFVSSPLTYMEAAHACRTRHANLARVGQLYSSWRFLGLDRCDGGWLHDGSVRFPITNPRKHCGGIPRPGVHSFGFPNKNTRLYGAYCYG